MGITIDSLIAQERERLLATSTELKSTNEKLRSLQASVESGDASVADEVDSTIAKRGELRGQKEQHEARIADLEVQLREEEEVTRMQNEVTPAAAIPAQRAYDEVARVGQEERTYALHKERSFDKSSGQLRRGFGRPGAAFETDVARAFLGDWEAQERLARHKKEEQVERGDQLVRAAGTSAFAGLTVPQYLTDFYAPAVAASRPFADAINRHVLPEGGTTVNISRITTATTVAVQSSENSAVSETNIDDTLLTVNVKTAGGQQTLSRQAIERGTGVESVVLDDLFRRYATNLDSQLINDASTGLTNVATSIAYTDASPTVAELFPKFAQALSAVEAALLDMATGENLIVMHSRRWYWLQNALGTSFPLIGQPGLAQYNQGTNLAVKYGAGFRGILPNGAPVVVDNNIGTTLGAGTEDEIYVVDANECHVWEDPSAPVFIRAEQPAAASLGVLLVVYGYFAYTHARYTQAQKIAGTGLIAPTFTGV